jgi:pre-mRNA-processing factor 40
MQQAPQQFRPVGQAMPGVNMGMPGQMPHFPQPGQHMPHSGHVPPASQAVPMAYQAARPMSSAPMQPPPQAVFSGGHMPTMGAPMPPPSYTVCLVLHFFSFDVHMECFSLLIAYVYLVNKIIIAAFQFQPTSVPPVAQPWGTAPGQGVPLVAPMVQPGHQSMSASLPPVSTTGPLLHFHPFIFVYYVKFKTSGL